MEPQGERPVAAVIPFLAMVAVILAYLTYEPPLESARPLATSHRTAVESAAAEGIPARLWEDPFSAIDRQEPASAASLTDFAGSFSIIRSSDGGKEDHKIDVIAVSLFAAATPDREEKRLRRRYAVVSALAAGGYLPVRASRIGVFECGCECSFGRIPFEWFKASKSSRSAIVLWLDEGLMDEPLRDIRKLRESLPDADEFVWIGPQNSDTLKRRVGWLSKSTSGGAPLASQGAAGREPA